MFDVKSQMRRRLRLLAFYFTNPAARVHVRELAELLDLDPSNLSKELRRLENDGLFSPKSAVGKDTFSSTGTIPCSRKCAASSGKPSALRLWSANR